MNHNNSFQGLPYTVSNDPNSWLTFQDQHTDLVSVPSLLVTTPSSPNPVSQAAPMPTQLFRCPRCDRGFRRWQDRDRHISVHLPHPYYCRFPRCPWRGDRPENVPKHWNNMHPEYGPAPSRQQSQIYDSKQLVTAIVNDILSVEEAAEIALSAVATKAIELEKGDVWENGWGRRTMTGQ